MKCVLNDIGEVRLQFHGPFQDIYLFVLFLNLNIWIRANENIRLMDFSFQSKLNLWDKFSRKSLSVSSKFKTFFPFCFCFVQHRVFFLYFIISLVRICHHTKTTPMCSLYISYLRLIYFVTQSLYLSLPHVFLSSPYLLSSGNHFLT